MYVHKGGDNPNYEFLENVIKFLSKTYYDMFLLCGNSYVSKRDAKGCIYSLTAQNQYPNTANTDEKMMKNARPILPAHMSIPHAPYLTHININDKSDTSNRK